MSTWLDLMNEIKRRSSSRALLPAQAGAYDRLCQIMSLSEWVNLCGPHGSGKTFLTWMVAQATGASFLSTPHRINDVVETQQGVIIDNAPRNEIEVRRLLSMCELLKAPTVLLVTRLPITIPMLQIELPPPSSSDIGQIINFVQRHGYFPNPEKLPENPNFWDIMLASV